MPAVLPRTVIRLTRRALALAVPLLLLQARAQTRTLPAIALQADSPYFSSPGSIRFGQPITFSARLPADATGTITWYVDGNAAQTTQLAPLTTSDYIAIGDSITYAGYIGDPAQRYQAIVAAAENLSVSTYASNGYTTCNTMQQNVMPNALGTSTLSNPLYSVETGANDLVDYGVGPNESLFNLCDQALLSWLGLPRSSKVLIGDPGVSIRSGLWSAAPAFGNTALNALTETSGSGTIRFALTTSGSAAYLWYLLQASTPGSFAVSVDDGPASTPTSTLFPAGTESIAGSYALLRIPVAAGVHIFDITAQSGTVSLFGMGTAPAAGSALPTVLATDVPNIEFEATPAGIAEYTADILNNLATLTADGLDLRFVPTQKYWFATAAENNNDNHPNALGLSEFAQAFESVLAPSIPASGAMQVAGATFTASNLALGNHSISASYSGDSKYAPTSSNTLAIAIFDASSTASIGADASIYNTASPVTLTATIYPADVSGLVNFIDQTASGSTILGSAWLSGTSATLTLPSLSAGQHSVVAQYLGDIQHNPSTSPPIAVIVSGSYTVTSLSAGATRYSAGSPVVLSASVQPASAAGTVTFRDGASVLGQSTLASGEATLTTSALSPGIHTLTASFSGNATQDSSTSPPLALEIDPNATTTAIAPLPASSVFGTPVTIAVQVSPATATGSVSLADSFVALNQTSAVMQGPWLLTLSNGLASIELANLAPGTHTFTATYSGNSDDLTSVSLPVSTQITLAAVAITLVPLPASSAFATPLSLTASVVPASATGTITFMDAVNGPLASIPVVNGSASFSTSALAPGSHSLFAAYSGDTGHAPATSPQETIVVNPIASSTTLGSLPATAYAGSSLTLAATVTPASATGSVIFRDANLGVLGQSTVSKGEATLTLPAPVVGPYSISAAYSGDIDDSASTSASIDTQVILNSSTTALTVSPASALINSPLLLTATVTPSSATGSVTFYDGAAAISTVPLSNRAASVPVSTLSAGSHSLHATYSGNPYVAASTSASVNATVSLNASSTTLSLAQLSVIAGSPFTVDVRVSSTTSAPAGTVTVRSGSTVLASGMLIASTGGIAYATLTGSSAALAPGTWPLVAAYSGDAGDQPSDSSASPVSLTVLPIPTTVSLSLSAGQIPILGTSTLTATVAAPGSSTPPTGSVTFSTNGSVIASVPLNSAGLASTTYSPHATGSLQITASYAPSGVFGASASAPQTLIVTPPFSAALNPASINAAPGVTAAATLTLTPLSGFAGALQAVCQTTASFLTCTAPVPKAIGGSAPLSVPITISVARSSAALSTPASHGFYAISVMVLAIPFILRNKRRRLLRTLSVCLLALTAFAMNGCAEGGDFNSVPAGPQTVAITLTAAGISDTTSLTVNIVQ